MPKDTLTVHRKGYWRDAYTRKDGVKVPRTWIPATTYKIKDRGAPGRGPNLIHVKHNQDLIKYGYRFGESEQKRRSAIRKMLKDHKSRWVIWRLNAIRNLQHRTNPQLASKAKKDISYVQSITSD